MFPTFSKQCFNGFTDNEKKLLKRWTVLKAMAHVLKQFKSYSVNGVDLVYQGRFCKFYPIPIFVSGDWQEYQMIAGLSASPKPREDNFPDVETLVSGSQLDAIAGFDEDGHPFKRRTEQDTLSILRQARRESLS